MSTNKEEEKEVESYTELLLWIVKERERERKRRGREGKRNFRGKKGTNFDKGNFFSSIEIELFSFFTLGLRWQRSFLFPLEARRS